MPLDRRGRQKKHAHGGTPVCALSSRAAGCLRALLGARIMISSQSDDSTGAGTRPSVHTAVKVGSLAPCLLPVSHHRVLLVLGSWVGVRRPFHLSLLLSRASKRPPHGVTPRS